MAYIGLRSRNIVMGSDIPQICLKIILLAITYLTSMPKCVYRVINLRMPKSKPLLSHYLLSEHVFILGAFNQFSAYILIFEIGFLIFQNLIFGPKW